MSRLEKLIAELCPDGVVKKHIWELTTWDKRYVGVERHKQPQIKKYKYIFVKEFKNIAVESGDIKLLVTGANDAGFTNEENVAGCFSEGEIVAIPGGGTPSVQYYKGKFVTADNRIATSIDISVLDNKFLFYWMQNNIELIGSYYRGSGIQHPDMSKVLDTIIPVPPLPVQKEIVRILDQYSAAEQELETQLDAELEAREKQYAYYRDAFLDFSPDKPRIGSKYSLLNKLIETLCPDGVEYMKLGEIGKVSMCRRIYKEQTANDGDVPFFKIGTFGGEPNAYISFSLYREYRQKYPFPKKGDVLLSAAGTIGKAVIYDGKPAYFQDSNIVWLDNNESILSNKYLYYLYSTGNWRASEGGTISRLYNDDLRRLLIPVPPLPVQIEIVRILDHFDTLVNDIKQGLPAEISARRKQYEYYRDKLLTFKEKQP